MSALYKLAEDKKKKSHYVDPYILAGTGLAGAGVYYAGEAHGGHLGNKMLNNIPEDERDMAIASAKFVQDKDKLKAFNKEQLKKIKEIKNSFGSALKAVASGDPVKYRNKNALISAGLTTGALGVMLHGAHNTKNDDKKYHKVTSASIPGVAMGLSSLGLLGSSIWDITQRDTAKANRKIMMSIPLTVAGFGVENLIKHRDRKHQYTDVNYYKK